MADQELLDVRIMSPGKDVFSGRAASVSSTNSAGNFDILPEHAKFVTLVEEKPLVVRLAGGEKKEFNFHLAILHVYANKVDIYINPAEAMEEFNRMR